MDQVLFFVSLSVDSLLQSREADPETVLQNLGFAGSEALAKIPARFLQQPSKVGLILYLQNKLTFPPIN